MTVQESPSWVTWREGVGVVCYRPHVRRTATIAVGVGTVLFCINQLDVVLRGDATALVWIKSAVTYVVPFCVANAGVLVGTRRDAQRAASQRDAAEDSTRLGGDQAPQR